MADASNSRIVPQEFPTSANISHHSETEPVGFRMSRDEDKPVTTPEIKQEKDDYLEVGSDEKLKFRINKNFCQGNTEVANGQKSELEDFTDKEINEKLASFIQFILTNKQPVDRFETLYNGFHRPANIPALQGVQLYSTVNGVLQTEGSETEDTLVYTQNCMLNGISKTSYVMDTLFNHVDKLPKELQPKQLMSDLSAAMKFFGAANLEFIQMRKEKFIQRLKCSSNELLITTIRSDNHLFPEKISRSFNMFKKSTDTV